MKKFTDFKVEENLENSNHDGAITWINLNKHQEYSRLGRSFKTGDLVEFGFYKTDLPKDTNYEPYDFAYLYLWRLDTSDEWHRGIFLFDTTPKDDEYFTEYKEEADKKVFDDIETNWERIKVKK